MEVLFREVPLYAQCISNSQGLSLRLHERTGQSSPYSGQSWYSGSLGILGMDNPGYSG